MAENLNSLSSKEAAKKLGITQELLWAYVRYAPKQVHKRKLPYHTTSNTFSLNELEEWDAFLYEPWADGIDKRPDIPTYIQDYLKIESGGQCSLCGAGHKLENAHIVPYEQTRVHHPHNLIRICANCHSKYDDGIISREHIEQCKQELITRIRQRIDDETELNLPLHNHNVPLPDSLFVGREGDLKQLLQLIEANRVVVVHGLGGIGKTQLVLHVLQFQSKPALWIDSENLGSFDEIEMSLSRQVMDISPRGNAQIEHYAGNIVFDGLEKFALRSWENTFTFILNITNRIPQAKIIITSQTELIGLRPTPAHVLIQPLSKEDIDKILSQHLAQFNRPFEAASKDVDWLVRFADGHPLTARIIASLLEYFKDAEQVSQRISKTGSQSLRVPLHKHLSKSTALDSCLQVAYDCFDHDQKRLLQYISNFPSGCFLVRAKQWQENTDFEVNLAEIRRFQFADIHPDAILGTETIKMLNPVKEFVRSEWATNSYEEAAEIQFGVAEELAFLASYIVFEKLQGKPSDKLEWGMLMAEADLPNFLATMRYAVLGSRPEGGSKNPQKYLPLIVQLGNLSTFFFMSDYLEYGIRFALLSSEANTKLGKYDDAIEDLSMVARLQHRAYDFAGFVTTIERLNELAKETNNSVSLGTAEACLGLVAHAKGENIEAIAHYKQALKHFQPQKDAGIRYRFGVVLHDTGIAYEHLGKYIVALKFYRRNLTIQRETKASGDLGSTFHHMANCYSRLGEQSKATRYYIKAAKHFSRIGNGQYLTNSLSELGHSLVKEDDITPIRRWFTLNMVVFALESLRLESEVFIRNYSTDTHQIDHVVLISKIFNVVKLISFTPHVGLLSKWSNDFRLLLNNWLDDIRAKYGVNIKSEYQLERRDSYILNVLWKVNDMMLIASAISEGNINSVETLFDDMFDPPYIIYSEPEEDLLTPFQWLRIWKQFKSNPSA